VALSRHLDVRGFQIAMDDAVLVRAEVNAGANAMYGSARIITSAGEGRIRNPPARRRDSRGISGPHMRHVAC